RWCLHLASVSVCTPSLPLFIWHHGPLRNSTQKLFNRQFIYCDEIQLNSRNTLLVYVERTMVVFSVKAEEGGAYGPFDTDRTMTYNTVITNIGNAYNVSTGVFTAPVAGVYYFTFFYHAGGEHVSKLILHKNKEPVVMTSDHNGKVTRCNSETADNGGNAVFLKLEKGDKVSVQLPAGAHVWASEGHTTFSGFLVNSC
uniref:C1q domain-containing protein n=1 Tax=Seriola dumerili TaxID=41447 RepID=A0A3B4UKZ9_SERDU